MLLQILLAMYLQENAAPSLKTYASARAHFRQPACTPYSCAHKGRGALATTKPTRSNRGIRQHMPLLPATRRGLLFRGVATALRLELSTAQATALVASRPPIEHMVLPGSEGSMLHVNFFAAPRRQCLSAQFWHPRLYSVLQLCIAASCPRCDRCSLGVPATPEHIYWGCPVNSAPLAPFCG